MAKQPTAPTPDATPLAERVVVRHLSSHENVPSVAEILVSGKRVGYISYGAGFPISFLPKAFLGFKMKAEELRTISAVARAKVEELAAAESGEASEIARLLAGEV